uniref:Transposase n=1 Tax=Loa loa TaxID=7209 RepID=A0A1I7VT77_LOALO
MWKTEYLTSLRERSQREMTSLKRVEIRSPRENEIVVLSEPGTPRCGNCPE